MSKEPESLAAKGGGYLLRRLWRVQKQVLLTRQGVSPGSGSTQRDRTVVQHPTSVCTGQE